VQVDLYYKLGILHIADELAAAGHAVPEDEQVSFILAGLGAEYDSLVAAIGVMTSKISLSEL
jgi:hypothetical protein